MEQPLVITNREELIFMLCEAAQLEHMLLCEYLFAAFSLKRSADEGLTETQLQAVRRWDRAITAVAIQEMLHLALVTNLLTALGSAPYLTHPNFPQRAKYFPQGVQLALLPFGEHALRHFLYLERPEGMTLEDAPEFALLGAAEPVAPDDTIVPTLEPFATVGHLYRGIEHGFTTLCERYGEQQVFIGPARVQATTQSFGWPELIAVTDLASARGAIETIVEEGEGARGDWTRAHYGKFLAVLQDYLALRQDDPGFVPARKVLAAVVRAPADVAEVPLIGDPITAGVAGLFNASYEVMLQVLTRFFIHSAETDAELAVLRTTALALMRGVLTPLGRLLTTLPVGADHPGMMAGPSFEIYRTSYLLPHHDPAWLVLQERMQELASYGARLAATVPGQPPEIVAAQGQLQQLAATLAQCQREQRSPTGAHGDASASTTPASTTQAGITPGEETRISFARDIGPLFRERDVQSMAWAFDLRRYEQVRANAAAIYARLSSGTMPCDGAWPQDRVALFKQWMDAGYPA